MYDQTMRAYRLAVYQVTEVWRDATRLHHFHELEHIRESGEKLLTEMNDSLTEDELTPGDTDILTDLVNAIRDDAPIDEVRSIADRLEGVVVCS